MAVKGLKLRDYEYRKGLKIYRYLYFCPFCERAYTWEELCEHYLFELHNVPYFTNDQKEREEYEHELEKYRKALSDLDNEVETGKISPLEFWEKLGELKRKFEKVKEKFVLDYQNKTQT